MGIFTFHSCEELKTWSPSSEVSFLGIPRESQDLCNWLSYRLCGEDKRITEIHPTISVIYFFAQGNFKSVSQSFSRWLSRALCRARIELNYTGHSAREASTSAAAAAGLSADLILEAADWASVHKESSAGAFARAVLNGYIYHFTEYLCVIQLQEALYCCRTLSFFLSSLRSYCSLWLCYFALSYLQEAFIVLLEGL